MGFQTVVNAQQAPAVQGDFASTNPFSSILAPNQGQLVAPLSGLIVGNFANVDPATGNVSQAYSAGQQIGFLGRNEQALITAFLGESSLIVRRGVPVVLFDQGEFWARFASGITVGQTVYASVGQGSPANAATSTVTATAGATGTLTTVNGSASVPFNTVSAGFVAIGDVVTSANVPAGTTVVAQTAGVAGAAGTYTLSAAATASAGPTAFTSTSTTMRVSAVLTGGLNTGDVLSGTNVTAGTLISALGTGVGGIGTYTLSVASNFGPTTVTVVGGNTATGFKAASNALAGELAKITSWS